MDRTAFIFPGQGAQYVGMGKDFYHSSKEVKAVFARADDVLGSGFSSLIFEGPMEKLTETKYSQPAIYITSFAIFTSFQLKYPHIKPYVCAGLSLGEYTALAASGKISFEEGLELVAKRGELMQRACEIAPGSMRVVLAMEEKQIAEILLPMKQEVCVANLNCPGQVVIAGTKEGLEKASEALKAAGAKRVLPLEVSGAFHSFLMQSAREGLTPFLEKVHLQESPVRFVMNTPGDFVEDLAQIRKNLMAQVTEPVCWQKGIEAIELSGVTAFIEMGPGKTLQGMNKRIGVKVPTYSIEKMEELEQEVFAHGAT